MRRSTKPDARRLRLRQHLHHALEEFFEERMGGSGDIEVSIVDDLILLRCKGALSPSEVNVATMKGGRLFLQEASDRLCQDLQPDLGRLLYRITGLSLRDICVGSFVEKREKIYLFIMSDTLKK